MPSACTTLHAVAPPLQCVVSMQVPGRRVHFNKTKASDPAAAAEYGLVAQSGIGSEEPATEHIVRHIDQAQLNVLTRCRAHGHFLAFAPLYGGRKDMPALIPCWISLCARLGRVKGTRKQLAVLYAELAVNVLAVDAANESDFSALPSGLRVTA